MARKALDEVLDFRGRATLEAASAAGDELTAAQVAFGLREMGAEGYFTADSLGVAGAMRASFAQLADNLVEIRMLEKADNGYRTGTAFEQAVASSAGLLSASIGKYPGHLPEALICGATCAELGPIMRGKFKVGRSEAEIGRPFDTLLIGHWHQALMLKGVIVNGALKGFDEYARTRPSF